MEGATYAMKDSLEIMRALGIEASEIRLSGGGARSSLWRQMQADVYDQPVCTINATEGPAYGVARLAGVGTGVWGTVEEACGEAIAVVARHKPEPGAARAYRAFYPVFQGLYRSLAPDFEAITGVVARLSG